MKYVLEKLNVSSLTVSQSESFMTRQLNDMATIPAANITDTPLQAYLAGLIARHANYQKAIVVYRKEDETEKVRLADERRDYDILALGKIFAVELHSPVAAEADAAKSLTGLFKSYAGLATREYDTETTDIKHLLADLASTKFSKHVTTLACSKYITRLKDSNAAFETIYKNRSVATSAKVHYDTKALRTDLYTYYKEFSGYVLAMANATNSPVFIQILGMINNARKHYAELLVNNTSEKVDANTPIAGSSY